MLYNGLFKETASGSSKIENFQSHLGCGFTGMLVKFSAKILYTQAFIMPTYMTSWESSDIPIFVIKPAVILWLQVSHILFSCSHEPINMLQGTEYNYT